MTTISIPNAASAPANLAEDIVDVRSLSMSSCKSDLKRLEGYLCESELARAGRFHFRADHDRYVAARSFLRLQIGAFLDSDPTTLRFRYTPYGKPFVENCGLEFNLSHSGDWILFAFTRSAEIGIDVEQIQPMTDMRGVARHSFSVLEFARWEATPEEERMDAFYRYWTRKESFIKAIGEGLSFPLDSFEGAFGQREPARLVHLRGQETEAASWWMADLPGLAGYAGAVTARHAESAGRRLVLREITTGDFLSCGT